MDGQRRAASSHAVHFRSIREFLIQCHGRAGLHELTEAGSRVCKSPAGQFDPKVVELPKDGIELGIRSFHGYTGIEARISMSTGIRFCQEVPSIRHTGVPDACTLWIISSSCVESLSRNAEQCDIVDRNMPVESVLRACELLRSFRSEGELLRLRDMVQRTGLPKSTTHRILRTLQKGGLIEAAGTDQYRCLMRSIERQRRLRIGFGAQTTSSTFSAQRQRKCSPSGSEARCRPDRSKQSLQFEDGACAMRTC